MRYIADIKGPMLDYFVAKAMGIRAEIDRDGYPIAISLIPWDDNPNHESQSPYDPSSDWSLGGQIIEELRIELCPPMNPIENGNWSARLGLVKYFGETPLLAAMRVVVASHFGDSIDVTGLSFPEPDD